MEVELTQRDQNLLEIISKTGALSIEQVREIYGYPKKYHLRRLEKLSSEGYIKRKKGNVILRVKGLKAVGIDSKPEKKKDHIIQKKAEIAELFFRLRGWDIIFGTEYKNKQGLNRGSRIEAVVKNGGYKFAVYHLSSKAPKANTVTRYLNEINALPIKTDIDRAVIFCHSECAEIILGRVEKPSIRELLLLPYPGGISLIENRYTEYFYEEILKKKFPGIKQGSSSMRFTDYTWPTRSNVYHISDLLTNDAVKLHYLDNHFSNKLTEKMERKIIILCTHSKYQEIRKRYPEVNICVMTDTLSGFLPAPKGGK